MYQKQLHMIGPVAYSFPATCRISIKTTGQAEFSEPALSLILTMSTLKHRQKFFSPHSILRKYRTVHEGRNCFSWARGKACHVFVLLQLIRIKQSLLVGYVSNLISCCAVANCPSSLGKSPHVLSI